MRIIKVSVTTNGSGDGTGIQDNGERGANGVLYALQLVDGTFADGVDVVATFEQGDVSIPVLTKADFNTDQIVYPRADAALVADGSAASANNILPAAVGRFKVVVAQGGDTRTGSFIAYVLDD